MKESDLYEPVKSWMEERGFAVYPEVECRTGGGRADIVVTSGSLVGVVEMKQSLTLDLIEQALRWRGFAHYIWIAIPYKKNGYKKFVTMVLKDYGIGVLLVNKYGQVLVDKQASFSRQTVPHLKEALTEHHAAANVKGGQSGGGYVTPYKITMDKVRRYLQTAGDWASLSDILAYCDTHYATPRPSLAKALQMHEIVWCESKKEGGKLYFRCREGYAHPKGIQALTDKQMSVLMALQDGQWQTPTQIAWKLPGASPRWADTAGSLYVNAPLKSLIRKGLAEKNPTGRGRYRLTAEGKAWQLEYGRTNK